MKYRKEVPEMKIFQKAGKFCAMLLLPVLFAAAHIPAQAAEAAGTATIPVEVAVTGKSIPSDAEYQVTLEAVTADAPMPAETTLVMHGASQRLFGPVAYSVPGDYTYRITQKDMGHNRCTYDTAVYQVTVRVTNAADGGLNTELWAVKDGGTEKTDTIRFENSYRGKGGSGGGGGDDTDSTGTAVPASQTNAVTSPKTGDSANLALWICLAGISLAAIVLAAGYRNRKGQDTNAEDR